MYQTETLMTSNVCLLSVRFAKVHTFIMNTSTQDQDLCGDKTEENPLGKRFPGPDTFRYD